MALLLRNCALLLVCMLLAMPAGAQQWWRARTPHFVLTTNGNSARAQQILTHLEWLHGAYALLSPQAPSSAQPIEVVHFRDEASYMPFRVASDAPAFHAIGRGRSLIVVHEFESNLVELLNHEYFHAYANRRGWRLPAWLNEGLADYYSTIQQHDATGPFPGSVWAGHPVNRHLLQMRMHQPAGPSVSELFAQDRSSLTAHNNTMRSELYAHSWLLTHLLLSAEPWRSGFPAFLEAVRSEPAEQALLRVYGATPTQLQQALNAYLQTANFQPQRLALGQAQTSASFESVAVEPWEVPLLHADLLAILGRQSAAKSRLEGLASSYPDVPAIAESRGHLALEMLDLKAAQQHFEKAVSTSSSNPEVYHRLATLRCGMQSEEADCLDWVERSLATGTGPHREFLQYAISFTLNVGEFQRALAYMDRTQPETEEERFQLLTRRTFAQYRLDDFDAARRTLSEAAGIARTPGRLRQVDDLRKAIHSREETVLHQLLFSADESIPGERRKQALNRVLARFAEQPRAQVEPATLREVQCGDSLAILVDSPTGRLRLRIPRPMDLMVFRGTRRFHELDFVCGPQPEEAIQVGYLLTGTGTETIGVLRILLLPEATQPN